MRRVRGQLYLPVSTNRLVQLVRESNGGSVAEMLSQLGVDYGGFRNDEMQILTLILNAMVEARRDLIKSVVQGFEAERGTGQAAPHGSNPPMITNLASWIGAEFRRPRPNPWPRTTEEIDDEIIHVMTPGVAFATVEDADNSEVIRIDSD